MLRFNQVIKNKLSFWSKKLMSPYVWMYVSMYGWMHNYINTFSLKIKLHESFAVNIVIKNIVFGFMEICFVLIDYSEKSFN